jgi:hypothetical protein
VYGEQQAKLVVQLQLLLQQLSAEGLSAEFVDMKVNLCL